jgi:hypothetical protein
MAKTDVYQIRNMVEAAQSVLGEATAAKVMKGSESVAADTGKPAVTAWLRGAIDRLDALASKARRVSMMRSCGRACAERHAALALSMRKRRDACPDLDKFLAEETRRFGGGVRYARRGDVIEQVYEPRRYRRPARCYCTLAKGLEEREQLSATFCECSAGFVEATWSVVLGGPVRVKLLESAVAGSDICRFEIRTLPKGRRRPAPPA